MSRSTAPSRLPTRTTGLLRATAASWAGASLAGASLAGASLAVASLAVASLAGALVFAPLPAAAAAATKERCHAEGFSPVRRAAVVKRGKTWVRHRVPYDQGACHRTAAKNRPGDRYRTDCSGFVSMTWALDHSYTTGSFARDRDGWWHTISWSQLAPGDAIVAHTDDVQHIVLFVRWTGSGHTRLVSYESRGQNHGTVANVRSVSAMKSVGYHPIRLDRIVG